MSGVGGGGGRGGDDEEFRTQLELEELERAARETQEGQGSKDPYIYTDPTDGTVYEWDHTRQAWFPKISDDFIAAYQANYGIQSEDLESKEEEKAGTTLSVSQDQEQQTSTTGGGGEKRKGETEQAGWFDISDEHNTNVYVSNLPLDTTEEEFVQMMSKCGIVMKDPDRKDKLKIKLYQDNNGQFKGDGRCCYVKVESVQLALNIIDGSELRGKVIHVERAKFQMKGEYDPSKKPRKKKSKDKKKIKELQEKLLDWRPDRARGVRARFERTVIIKNMFDPKEFEADASLILEYQSDLREECSKFGTVKKVVVYDRHLEGVASVMFEEVEMGDACLSALNGRWFAGRQLKVETWDGKTKYTVNESESERERRLKQWDNFLEKGGEGGGGAAPNTTNSS